MSNYRNENEIVLYSLGRSGSHAIKNWIGSMFKEPVYCFNNCGIGDPFRAPIPYYRRVRNRPIKKFFVAMPNFKASSEIEINKFRNIHKLCLMYSYERKDIRELETADFVLDRDFTVGRSKNKYDALLLRDVFNWLASILLRPGKKHSFMLNDYPKYTTGKKEWLEHASIIPRKNFLHARNLIEYWKFYAQEFLRKTNYLKNQKVRISFNQWWTDREYRERIANELNLVNSDFSLDFLGSRSSFDGKKYRYGGALGMKVFDRWKNFKDNVVYQQILDMCPEVRELSYEIFGKEIGNGIHGCG